jgi:sigma-B regulation protein RsbU (phosphoserine phosphatase)
MRARVLVVDDSEPGRRLVAEALSALDVEVHEATDAPSGLDAVHRLLPAVAVCEWVLPGGGGLALCRAICEDAALACTRVVMLTSLVDPRDAHTARQSGASAFLHKPADADALRAVVAECLAGRRRFVRQASSPRTTENR